MPEMIHMDATEFKAAAERMRKLRAENVNLREALEYTLQCWEGSMNATSEEVMQWCAKVKAALLKEE
jgi:hypothetical protein